MLAEVDDAVELGCIVEANIDVEIPLEVEEYIFWLVAASEVEDKLVFNG